jgi:hypothetical protein
VSQVEWCLERSKIFKNAAALEDDLLRKAQLLGMAEQWTLASKVALRFTALRAGHGPWTISA